MLAAPFKVRVPVPVFLSALEPVRLAPIVPAVRANLLALIEPPLIEPPLIVNVPLTVRAPGKLREPPDTVRVLTGLAPKAEIVTLAVVRTLTLPPWPDVALPVHVPIVMGTEEAVPVVAPAFMVPPLKVVTVTLGAVMFTMAVLETELITPLSVVVETLAGVTLIVPLE